MHLALHNCNCRMLGTLSAIYSILWPKLLKATYLCKVSNLGRESQVCTYVCMASLTKGAIDDYVVGEMLKVVLRNVTCMVIGFLL